MDDAIRAAIAAGDLNAPDGRKRALYAAFASGFGSVRRFNDAFKQRYRLTSGQLRKRSRAGVTHALPALTPKQRLALAEAWRPWRSYAVMMLWNSL